MDMTTREELRGPRQGDARQDVRAGRLMTPRHRLAVAVAAATIVLALEPAASPVAARSPTPTNPMTVQFVAARHTGYRFDPAWRVVATKTVTLPRPSSASAVARRSIGGRVHLHVLNGIWAGYWVRESTLAYLRGITGERSYSPPVRVALPAGRYLGYRFDSAWALSTTKYRRLTRASGAHADRSAVINGRSFVRIVDGIWAGYWMPGTVTTPTPIACTTAGRPAPGARQLLRSVAEAGPELALTFDMGGRLVPARAILRQLVLDRVCATIFPTGASAATAEGTAALAIVRAHPELFEVGNHTMYHCNLRDGGGGSRCPSSPPSTARIVKELTDAAAIIQARAGQSPAPYWRPPFGAYDSRVLAAAASAGYTKTILWSVDTIDWRPVKDGGPTAYDIAVKIRSRTASGSIVLMHLGGYNTLDALPYALAGLRSRRLQPTTLSDLLDRAG